MPQHHAAWVTVGPDGVIWSADYFGDDVGEYVPIPRYRDAQLRLSYDLGEGARIAAGARIGSLAVIGAKAVIGEGASIESSVVGAGAQVGRILGNREGVEVDHAEEGLVGGRRGRTGRGLLVGIDATGPVDDVTQRAIDALRPFGGADHP